MSRLFLMVFVIGMLALAPTANADVPNCDCLDDNQATWPFAPENCLFVCPGAWGLPGHTAGTEADNIICMFSDDGCSVPLEGFDCMRINLSAVLPDSICVCDTECGTMPYIYPIGPTSPIGDTSFRWAGSILQLEDMGGVDVATLEVCGCQARAVKFRSPDVDADCTVGGADFVIWAGAFVICPPAPLGYQHYTVYVNHCAPCPQPQLADFIIFAKHFGHTCTPGCP